MATLSSDDLRAIIKAADRASYDGASANFYRTMLIRHGKDIVSELLERRGEKQ